MKHRRLVRVSQRCLLRRVNCQSPGRVNHQIRVRGFQMSRLSLLVMGSLHGSQQMSQHVERPWRLKSVPKGMIAMCLTMSSMQELAK